MLNLINQNLYNIIFYLKNKLIKRKIKFINKFINIFK